MQKPIQSTQLAVVSLSANITLIFFCLESRSSPYSVELLHLSQPSRVAWLSSSCVSSCLPLIASVRNIGLSRHLVLAIGDHRLAEVSR